MSIAENGATRSKILVVGAGGNLGERVVKQLLAAGYAVRALSRPQTNLEYLEKAGLHDSIHLDLSQTDVPTLTQALQGCSAIISTLGVKPPFDAATLKAVEFDAVKKLADAAKNAGVNRFILTSSIGASQPESIPFLTQVLIVKQQAEQYLAQSGLTYTVVRPGGLTNEPGGQALLVGRGDTIRGRISREDVATVLVQCLRQPTAHNQIIEIIADPTGKLPSDPQFFQ